MSIKILDGEWSWKKMILWEFLNEGNYPHEWKEFFFRDDIQDDLKNISKQLEKESKDCIIYPPINKVFRAFYSVSLKKVRVVVLGQDCFHDGAAVGLCFSVPPNGKINPSLRNIYTELEKEGYTPNKNGSLVHWAMQGCLMLNTALTVQKGTPESHLHIWYDFSEKVIKEVSSKTENVAWLLMGAKALSFDKFIDPSRGHRSFITSHPSPFSAYSGFRNYPAFIGSGVFKKIDCFLGQRKIEW